MQQAIKSLSVIMMISNICCFTSFAIIDHLLKQKPEDRLANRVNIFFLGKRLQLLLLSGIDTDIDIDHAVQYENEL